MTAAPLFGALWVEVASQLSTAAQPDAIVWRDDFPISYESVANEVAAGFSTLATEAADRCFLAGWRWERAGAHRLPLAEVQAHALWRQELMAIDHVLELTESYSRPLSESLAVPAAYAAKLNALGYLVAPVSMPDEAALALAESQLFASGAPQYLIDAGLASYGALRAGPQPLPALPPASRADRIERARARASTLPPDLRAQLNAIPVPPPEPQALDAQYYRRVQSDESDDLVLRGQTWGALETEFRDALQALKEACYG